MSRSRSPVLSNGLKKTEETLTDNILFSERQVILTDLHGFVIRNKQWVLPVDSQVLGYVQYDPSTAMAPMNLRFLRFHKGHLTMSAIKIRRIPACRFLQWIMNRIFMGVRRGGG